MNNSSLRVLKNDNSNPKLNRNEDGNDRKKFLMRFGIFIILILSIFSAIFLVKGKFDNVNSIREDLNFQKQKLLDERLLMEKTFKEESEKLSKLQNEFEEKNKKVTDTLNFIKAKEETLNNEIEKVEELRSVLQKQLIDIYGLNMDKQYNGKDDNDGIVNNSNAIIDDKKNDELIHMNMLGDEDKEKDQHINERKLSVANADWFIKFDSLGDFSY